MTSLYVSILLATSFLSIFSFKYSYNNQVRTNIKTLFSKTNDEKLITFNDIIINPCRIKIIGVGGGGSNAVSRMVQSSLGASGAEFWIVNTDTQALSTSSVKKKLNIGTSSSRYYILTYFHILHMLLFIYNNYYYYRGLGAGGKPESGRIAATESRKEIENIVKDADLVFVTAGMGGGTGSGAAPIVAECAKAAGALTIGVVTKPFGFEGRKRMKQAEEAIAALKAKVDTLIVVSNDKLLKIVPENTPLTEAFLVADDILRQGVVGVSAIIVKPGLVNVDFADVRTILRDSGMALMGIGQSTARGPRGARAAEAARLAMSSPLLDIPITSAKVGRTISVQGCTASQKSPNFVSSPTYICTPRVSCSTWWAGAT